MMSKCRRVLSALFVAGMLAAATPADAEVILDTGTPTGEASLSVFADPSLPGAQFLAQAFTLATTQAISTIEAYVGGAAGNTITMDLASAIGTGATAGDLIGSFTLNLPGTLPDAGAFVAAAVNQTLAAGTYFLVFSAGADGGFLPLEAPFLIGDRFQALDFGSPFTAVDTALPIASGFAAAGFQPGVRVSAAIPEPATLALSVVALAGLGFLRRRRRAAA